MLKSDLRLPARRNIFIGTEGLRAGWRLLLFAVIVATLTLLERPIRHWLPFSEIVVAATMSAGNLLFGIILFRLINVFIAMSILSKIEHRPLSAYGLGGPRKFRNFQMGVGSGLLMLSLLIFGLILSGHLVIDRRGLIGHEVVVYSLVWFLVFLVGVFMEEILFRGYVPLTLARGLASIYRSAFKTRHAEALGFWTSAILCSILFGLLHGTHPGESPLGLVQAGIFAFVCFVSLRRSGSLWWAVGFHVSWDYGQSFLFGVGDSGVFIKQSLLLSHPVGIPLLSGGYTGPEGSLYALPVLALSLGLIYLTFPGDTSDKHRYTALNDTKI